MMNKPGDIKNNYFITFIMELADMYGTDQVAKLCERFGYKTSFPKEMEKQPKRLQSLIKIAGFDD
jgi:cell division control protein 7